MRKYLKNIVLFSIVIISFIMHYKHFSKDIISIHSWRQTQTQSTINNFYEEDMNILNPRRNDRGSGDGIFRMEFPLMQWIVAGSYHLFGNSILVTRLFMFGIGILSVLGIYTLLLSLFRKEILALMGAWAFNFSPSFFYYTINPLPDNLALCCAIWGLVLFFKWTESNRPTQLFLCGVLLSIGALCKLPFILYFIVPAVYFLRNIMRTQQYKKNAFQGVLVFTPLIFPLLWYVTVIPEWKGNGIVSGMFDNSMNFSTLLDYLIHNLISTLPELLLNYGSVLFFIAGFYFLFKKKAFRSSHFLLIVALSFSALAYFIFEINMIAKIHDYYLFPFYPLLFILVGYGAFYIYSIEKKNFKIITMCLLCALPITCYIRMYERWVPESPGFNKDLLKYKSELREITPNDALVIIGNDVSRYISFYYIDKKGWGFDNDNLTPEKLTSMIDNGASYLYSDSRKIDTNKYITPFLDKLILEKGSIKVFLLKQ